MLRWFKSIVTDENWDFDPVLFAIVFCVFYTCGMTLWQVKKGHEWDPEKFGNSIAFIIGAGGVGYAAKRVGEKHGMVGSSSDS